MGLYAHYLFPWIIDRVMAREVLTDERKQLLSETGGQVLEIGFGTGLNLRHYPSSVDRLTIVDPNRGMHRRAAKRIRESRIPVDSLSLAADQALPVPEGAFDCVVSTWTMCSITDLVRALDEMHRVLKPGGRLFFIEHGLSRDPGVARWQNRINPVNKWIGDGCHLNRDIKAFLSRVPLRLERCEEFELPSTPRVGAWTYRGVATKD